MVFTKIVPVHTNHMNGDKLHMLNQYYTCLIVIILIFYIQKCNYSNRIFNGVFNVAIIEKIRGI